MKRFLTALLSMALLLSFCVPSAASAQSNGIRVPGSWVRGGAKILRASGLYSESIRFLTYAFESVDHVTYGETSVLARKLAKSEQLNEILENALAQELTETDGIVSFYDGSDLEYSIGTCGYSMRLDTVNGKRSAIFILKDTYDFTEVRGGGSLSNLLNNLGYEWQKNGTIKAYTWMVKVVIPVEEDK